MQCYMITFAFWLSTSRSRSENWTKQNPNGSASGVKAG